MTSTGSISVSGLLGGTAGQIDTTTLISQLMVAAALPQTQLKDQLTAVGKQVAAYQTINTRMTALQTAAQALTDPTAWTATTAASSVSSVVATSDGSASVGATTFSVTKLAQAQITGVAADTSGNVADPATGITLSIGGSDYTFGTDPSADFSLASGSASDVASAINKANLGVRASVITTDQGSMLQLTAAKTGSTNSFAATGFETTAQTVVAAQDAQVTVGDPAAGGYSVSSSSNTFSSFIPGVTFSVSAVASNVTVTVTSDATSISNKLAALVNAANTAVTELNNDSGQGAVLQGKSDVRSAVIGISAAVSSGAASGASLKKYGIDMDSTGHLSFDADAFATAYAADPAGTKAAIASSFASSLNDTATAAVDPVTGSVTASIAGLGTKETSLNDGIDSWTDRLTQIHDNLTLKYAAMESALAKLQSQQSWLTSMFDSLNNSDSSSSSS